MDKPLVVGKNQLKLLIKVKDNTIDTVSNITLKLPAKKDIAIPLDTLRAEITYEKLDIRLKNLFGLADLTVEDKANNKAYYYLTVNNIQSQYLLSSQIGPRKVYPLIQSKNSDKTQTYKPNRFSFYNDFYNNFNWFLPTTSDLSNQYTLQKNEKAVEDWIADKNLINHPQYSSWKDANSNWMPKYYVRHTNQMGKNSQPPRSCLL